MNHKLGYANPDVLLGLWGSIKRGGEKDDNSRKEKRVN